MVLSWVREYFLISYRSKPALKTIFYYIKIHLTSGYYSVKFVSNTLEKILAVVWVRGLLYNKNLEPIVIKASSL
jgi:hypothetical protein